MSSRDEMHSDHRTRLGLTLVFDHFSSFVRRDALILSDDFLVRRVRYRGKRDLPLLAWRILTTSLNVSWFALGYAYSAGVISRALRKPNVIIVGGWDVAFEPEIDYGAMNNPRRIRMTTRALQSASLVLAASEACREEVFRWVSREVHVVPNGVDTRLFSPLGEKSPMVVTVANMDNEVKLRVKGIDILLKVSERLPSIPFRLIGRVSPPLLDRIRRAAPPNLVLTGWLSEQDLIQELRRAQVYLQPSFRESFGVSVVEAMSCGCTPVVANRMALPEVVGDAGFVCEYGDVDATMEAVLRALESDGMAARARVAERFSMETRRRLLLQLLGGLS